MKRSVPVESASALIDEKIRELGDWRGKTLAKVREIIRTADPEIVEEWKWVKPTSPGVPVFYHGPSRSPGERPAIGPASLQRSGSDPAA